MGNSIIEIIHLKAPIEESDLLDLKVTDDGSIYLHFEYTLVRMMPDDALKLAKAVLKVQPHVSVGKVGCHTCGAQVGRPCLGVRGKPIRSPHHGRVLRAKYNAPEHS